jgi:hypothetical protein
MLIFTHPDCLEHAPCPGHPEYLERLHAVLNKLRTSFDDQT